MPLSTALNGTNSQLRHARDQLRERGLADAGRPPQDDAKCSSIPLDLPAQRFARPEDMLLPDEILESARAACAPPADACRSVAAGPGGVMSNRLIGCSVLLRRAS